jgi:hypothetical protein
VFPADAGKDYSDYGCVIVIVLTHGEERGYLHAFDGLFKTCEVWEPFFKSETLRGKPKIFIFQVN